MREVRTCDFCGEKATGVYEVVPAEAGATADARRMLLCDGCRDTLASVVDPLLDALDGDAPADADRSRERDTDGATPATDGTDDATREAARSTDPDPAVEAAGEDPPEAGGRPMTERGPPAGYRKVMRFLENRELPMDRADAESLVADAYGMSESDVTDAIDHAVKHDRLRDVNGELRR